MSKHKSEPNESAKETGRVEAFSDGVFAIALTLLILDVKVPRDLPDGTSLVSALLQQWPTYVAFLTSFITIGLMWLNHHSMLKYVQRVDNKFLILNGLVLLVVTIIPFPTALLAEYALKPDAQAAAIVYGATFVILSPCFYILWRYSKRYLLVPNPDPKAMQALNRQNNLTGMVLGFITIIVALISVPLSIVMYLVSVITFTAFYLLR